MWVVLQAAWVRSSQGRISPLMDSSLGAMIIKLVHENKKRSEISWQTEVPLCISRFREWRSLL